VIASAASQGLAAGVPTRESLAADLRALGARPGQVLLIHASARRIGPVHGGAAAVVAALREVAGPAGTLVVPAMTAENSDTSRSHLARIAGMTPS
jgi:aminoglycoside 3-N-acetyltransferase